MEHKATPATGAGKPRCLTITYSTDSGARGSVAVPYRRLWALILVSVFICTWCLATASVLIALALSPSASKVAFLAIDSLAEMAESLSQPSPAIQADVAPTHAVAKPENMAQPMVVATIDSPQHSAAVAHHVKAEPAAANPLVAKSDATGASVSVEPKIVGAAQPHLTGAEQPESPAVTQPKSTTVSKPELTAAAKSETATAAKPESTAALQPDLIVAAQPKLTVAAEPAQRKMPGSPAELIRLEQVRFDVRADKLEMRLFIAPLVKGVSVRGNFIAQAVFQTDSGVLRILLMPTRSFLVKAGPTREDLVFTAPRGTKGSFTSVALTLTVAEYDQPLVARYPIRTRKPAATAKFSPVGANEGAVQQ